MKALIIVGVFALLMFIGARDEASSGPSCSDTYESHSLTIAESEADFINSCLDTRYDG